MLLLQQQNNIEQSSPEAQDAGAVNGAGGIVACVAAGHVTESSIYRWFRLLLIICNAYLKVVFLVECGLHMKVNCVMK